MDSKYIDRNGGWVKPEGMNQWAKENKVQARERVCINDIDYELFVLPDGWTAIAEYNHWCGHLPLTQAKTRAAAFEYMSRRERPRAAFEVI